MVQARTAESFATVTLISKNLLADLNSYSARLSQTRTAVINDLLSVARDLESDGLLLMIPERYRDEKVNYEFVINNRNLEWLTDPHRIRPDSMSDSLRAALGTALNHLLHIEVE